MNQRKLQALARHGFEVSLLTPKTVKDTLREIKLKIIDRANFKTYPVRSYFGFHNSFRIYNSKDIRRAMEQIKPDIVLVEQEPYSLSTFQVMRLKKKFGFRAILFTFQNIYKDYPLPFNTIESQNLKLADRLIVGNNDALEVWKRKGTPLNEMVVLPQVGVDLEEFFPTDKLVAKEKFGLDGFIVGYAGRFVEEKGLSVLISALSKLKDLPITLALAGKGPYKETLLKEIRSHGLENRVKFVEGLTHEEISSFMNALDIFVLPSLTRKHWREQFGHVLIEAMACGVPCIVTAADPMDVIVGEAGMTFQEGDSNDLAKKIRSAYNSPEELKRLGQSAIARVSATYTNDIIAIRIRELAEKLDRV